MAILEAEESFDDIILMPYLEGYEISVDCLNTKKGLIAIPREKGSSRDERVFYDEDILNSVKIVSSKIDIKYPFNVQFKYKGDTPYLTGDQYQDVRRLADELSGSGCKYT